MSNQEASYGGRKFTGRKEIGLICLVALVLGFVIFFFPRGKTGDIIATVYYQSEEYTKINLTQAEDGTIIEIAADLPVTLKIKNHHIRFVDAQCPDKVCEGYGYIGSPGQQAICLPAKVGIVINSASGGVDMTSK